MVTEACSEDVFVHMEGALRTLLRGLRDYKDGENGGNHKEQCHGISNCQLGSRNMMMGQLMWKVHLGASHAIGNSLKGVCGVMYGVISGIMLAPVLRVTRTKCEKQEQSQQRTLDIWNKALIWKEVSLADAVERFVRYLELPCTLKEAGVEKQEDVDKIAEGILTDYMFDSVKELIGGKEGVLAILESAKS